MKPHMQEGGSPPVPKEQVNAYRIELNIHKASPGEPKVSIKGDFHFEDPRMLFDFFTELRTYWFDKMRFEGRSLGLGACPSLNDLDEEFEKYQP